MERGEIKKEASGSLVQLLCMIFTLIFLIFWFITGLLITNFIVIILCGILIPIPVIVVYFILIDHQKMIKKRLIEKKVITKNITNEPKRQHEEKVIDVGKLLEENE